MAEPHVVLAAMTASDARAALARCCGSARWADAMLSRRPWPTAAALFADAAAIWWALDREAWLEAFAQHPRIGAGGTDAWSRQEQAAAAGADAATRRALQAANDRYVERFGYIFIVCATGKSAAEMLCLIEARLDNDPDRELAIAAGEQARIIHLRLEKLSA
ncbi:MAG TPA: 2-oxo-4-hydroxy-4-carboxy-5-ureidoimidazoline decarboxylase [Polyangia bacterium]|nr:2-oxo-4-hydroxy-4-carboxy-5-ureidoimidazoline decarboxylase [Polyangia bacterium]